MRTYLAINKDKSILKTSSSGGVFYCVASYYLTHFKSSVYGAAFGKNNVVHHIRITEVNELYKLQGSKYVRSNLENTFNECKEDLIDGFYVVFTGTPCQINALNFYLSKLNIDLNKLITIDFICHGTPKPSAWEKYIKENHLENSSINFRCKNPSWEGYSLKIDNLRALV